MKWSFVSVPALFASFVACGGPRDPAFVTDVAREAPRDADKRPAGERAILNDAAADLDSARAAARGGNEELSQLFADRARARFALAALVHERTEVVTRLATREGEVRPLEADARTKERERLELAALVKNLEARVEILDRALGPGTTRAATEAREEARRAAAAAMLERADLFCSAAKLLGHSIPPELQARLDRAARGVPPNPPANLPAAATSAIARTTDEATSLRAECLFALNRTASASTCDGGACAGLVRRDVDTRAETTVKEAVQSGFTANVDEVGAHIDMKSASLGTKELEAIALIATHADARVIFELPRGAVSAMDGYRAALKNGGLDGSHASYVVASRRGAGTVGIDFVLAR